LLLKLNWFWPSSYDENYVTNLNENCIDKLFNRWLISY
jgi:hypothetical protein